MTTTVTVHIAGNKNCIVRVVDGETVKQELPLRPGALLQFGIHGEQTLSVKELVEPALCTN
jgi:hypothetical protein